VALSPTDFYAYSRATGTPFPEDAEERAQRAPEVLEFRRNQLKSKDEDFNVTNALGTVAALAGIGAGGFGLTRILGRKPPIKKAYTSSPVDVTRIVNEPVVTPSKVVNQPAASQRNDPSGTSTLVKKDSFTPRSYIEGAGSVAPDLTSLQDQLDPLITKQSVEASDPGLDQVVNRGVVIPAQREVTGFTAFSRKADRIERVSNEIQDFSQELSKINNHAASTKKSFTSLQSISSKLASDQSGFTRLSEKELKNIQAKVALDAKNLTLNIQSGKLTKDQLTETNDVLNKTAELTKLIEKRLDREKEITKAVGLTGNALTLLNKLPGIAGALKTEEALVDMKYVAEVGYLTHELEEFKKAIEKDFEIVEVR
jgi:hypothetical protein